MTERPATAVDAVPPAVTERSSLGRLAVDALGIAASAAGFGVVYGLSAREAGLSLVEALAMSVFSCSPGAARSAALGLMTQGVPWIAIVVFTGLPNARHLLYSAALEPWVQGWSRMQRAAMAHV